MKSIVVLSLVLFTASLVSAEDPVYFADANLKAAVEAQLGITDPTPTNMLELTYLSARTRGIIGLSGIEYGVNYNPDGGGWNGGMVTGFWSANGSAFTLALLDNLDLGVITYDHINIIPEPTTLSLFVFGAILAGRKRRMV